MGAEARVRDVIGCEGLIYAGTINYQRLDAPLFPGDGQRARHLGYRTLSPVEALRVLRRQRGRMTHTIKDGQGGVDFGVMTSQKYAGQSGDGSYTGQRAEGGIE